MSKFLDLTVGPWRFIVQRLGKRYQVRYKFNKKHLVADIILFLGVVFLILFNLYVTFVFGRWTISLQVKVDVAVMEPVLSGGKTVITVDYFNGGSKEDLEEAVLSLTLPEQLVIKEVSDGRYDADKHSLDLGLIPARTGGRLTLTGETWGNYNSEQKIYARLDYWQQSEIDKSLKWQDEKIAIVKYRLGGSVVDCQVSLPSTVVNNIPFDFSLKCVNNYDATISGLELKFPPKGILELISTAPALNEEIWKIGSLAPGKEAVLNGQAKINNLDPSAKINWSWQLFGEHNKGILFLAEPKKELNIFYPQLKIGGLINGQENYAPIPGEEIEYVINYTNGESQEIKDLTLTADLSDPFFQPETVSSIAAFKTDGRQIVFGNLGSLPAKGKGELKFKVKLNRTIPSYTVSPASLKLVMRGNYSLNYQGQELTAVTEESIVNILSSTLGLSAFARYYTLEGEQLGIGPLPPLVGIPTQYRIYWQVSNSTNNVSAVKVSGTLPDNINWTGQESVSIGSGLNFNPKTRELSWSLDSLDTFVGYSSSMASASFSLELNPLTSQVGKSAILLQNIKIIGHDNKTGHDLSADASVITTDLPNDSKAAGKGKVRGL